MKTLILVTHPNYDESNTQSFFKEACSELETVTIYRLAEYKATEVLVLQQLIRETDRLIFQFPLYWYSCPGELKIWIDHLWTPTLYQQNLVGKELGIVVSTGVSEEAFQAGGQEKFTLSELLRPFEALANKSKMLFMPIFSLANFNYLSEEEKKVILINYQQYLTKINSPQFKIKEQWFIDNLKKKNKMIQTDSLAQVIHQLEENQDYLLSLQDSLAEMKEEL
ncbi:NAD(P)H-dependent oxidoreductase [Vagococcus sp.]|uniref:NAD(P)H-dependent oxidoreductase n=1 Tax=Vagococcus sp. TaxID=1933889 RepID=UPI003F94CE77